VIEVIEVHPVVIEEKTVTVFESVDRQVVFGGEQGLPGTGSGDMKKLIYDPHGFEIDVFDLGHMTGTLDAGTF
jgi:hypothetical protein